MRVDGRYGVCLLSTSNSPQPGVATLFVLELREKERDSPRTDWLKDPELTDIGKCTRGKRNF